MVRPNIQISEVLEVTQTWYPSLNRPLLSSKQRSGHRDTEKMALYFGRASRILQGCWIPEALLLAPARSWMDYEFSDIVQWSGVSKWDEVAAEVTTSAQNIVIKHAL